MVIFVGVNIIDNKVCLEIRGQKYGNISGTTVSEACNKLLPHIYKTDIVYADCRGYGIGVADILEKACEVVRVKISRESIIKE